MFNRQRARVIFPYDLTRSHVLECDEVFTPLARDLLVTELERCV